MKIVYEKSFLKSLKKLNLNYSLKQKLKYIIQDIESSQNINDIKNITKIVNYNNYFRIRFNNYRIGVELLKDNSINLVVIAHRKEIYKIFP